MRIRRLLSPLPKKAPVLLATLTFTFVFALVAAYQVAMHLGHDEEAKILASLRSSYAEATKKRDLVILEKVPGHFTQALLTHEDRRFLEHHGLNWSSTLRAAFQNLSSYLRGGPAIVSGASTLTQQLAKNLLFSQQKKSLGRKIRQLQASRILEQNFSKEDILTMYLNVVYFGQGAWGLAQAGKVYFQTSYEKLSLEQSAMLVPFLEAPAIYNMVHNPQLAKKRQDHLLAKLQQN